ncbi:MAG: serine protease [Ruminococcaceae bacterium]|nr:serine protease [Oscillospiraceae bacterium]
MRKRSVCMVAVLCVIALCLQGCSVLGLDSLMGAELTPTELYYTCAPSVVEIRTEAEGGGAVGSGFFCDNKGTVITNYHVIENFAIAKVYALTGEEYAVTAVKGYDIKRDIAVLETDCKNSIPLQFNAGGTITGATVYTIGSSLGMTSTLSEGIVSCAIRQLFDQEFIQITAPISPGNSGGPLFDAYGYVIGVNTLTFMGGQNMNLAVPIQDALDVNVSNPTTLEKLFTRTTTSREGERKLNNWRVGYVPEEDSEIGKDAYTILFQVRDQYDRQMKPAGSVSVQIINDDNVSVYGKSLSFTGSDTVLVETREGTFEFMAVHIPYEDVAYGDTYFGMLNFTVSIDDYTFDTVPVRLLDLPVL